MIFRRMAIVILSCISVAASLQAKDYSGTYIQVSYPDHSEIDKKTCFKMGGTWNVASCRLRQEDPVLIKRMNDDGQYEVKISHYGGPKYDSCKFKGVGQQEFPSKIVVPGGPGYGFGTGSMERGNCVVSLKFSKSNRVRVETNGYCQNYCHGPYRGFYGRLEMNAVRVDRE